MAVAAVSGGFDPLHAGHVSMIEDAALLGEVTVILNTDDWLLRKKKYVLQPWEQRERIVGAIKGVTRVVKASDGDGTVAETLRWLKPDVFVKGGDRGPRNTPEASLCDELGIKLVFNAGDPSFKDVHSSDLVKRGWGEFRLLAYRPDSCRVKILTVLPGKSLSMQRHAFRDEHWYVVSGMGKLAVDGREVMLSPGQSADIPRFAWHRVTNNGGHVLEIVEVQNGRTCEEADIERVEDVACDHALA